MNKLNKAYNEFINSKEKNKLIINKNIEIMKDNKRKKSYFMNFATVMAAILILFIGYSYFNNKNVLKDNNKPNNSEFITIEGKKYYNYYDMGVNMEKVPDSNIYGYAIRQDKESYKIVSLHRNGTNFDLVAIDDPLETISSDMTDLTEYYKLILVDNKLYFIRLAYYNSARDGQDNSNVNIGKNQKYDIEVYYVDITAEHPKLELLLQIGDEDGIKYDMSEIMINKGYLYYHNPYSESGAIEALPLGNNPKKSNIVLEKKIFSYYINDNKFYVSWGDDWFDEDNIYHQDAKYAIVDSDEKDENGFNLHTTISEKEFYDKFSNIDIWTSNNLIHYFNHYNRYTTLWADNKQVTLKGFESQEKGVGFIGNKLLVNNKEVYKYDSSDINGITLLNTNNNIINFCIGEGSNCDADKYYSYNVQTGNLDTIKEAYNYFLLTYVSK